MLSVNFLGSSIEMKSIITSQRDSKIKRGKDQFPEKKKKNSASESEQRRASTKNPLLFSPEKRNSHRTTPLRKKKNSELNSNNIFKSADQKLLKKNNLSTKDALKLNDLVIVKENIKNSVSSFSSNTPETSKIEENEPCVQKALEQLFILDDIDGRAFRRLSYKGITLRDIERHGLDITSSDSSVDIKGENVNNRDMREAKTIIEYKTPSRTTINSQTPTKGSYKKGTSNITRIEFRSPILATPEQSSNQGTFVSNSTTPIRNLSTKEISDSTNSVVTALKQYLLTRHPDILTRESPGRLLSPLSTKPVLIDRQIDLKSPRVQKDITITEILTSLLNSPSTDNQTEVPSLCQHIDNNSDTFLNATVTKISTLTPIPCAYMTPDNFVQGIQVNDHNCEIKLSQLQNFDDDEEFSSKQKEIFDISKLPRDCDCSSNLSTSIILTVSPPADLNANESNLAMSSVSEKHKESFMENYSSLKLRTEFVTWRTKVGSDTVCSPISEKHPYKEESSLCNLWNIIYQPNCDLAKKSIQLQISGYREHESQIQYILCTKIFLSNDKSPALKITQFKSYDDFLNLSNAIKFELDSVPKHAIVTKYLDAWMQSAMNIMLSNMNDLKIANAFKSFFLL